MTDEAETVCVSKKTKHAECQRNYARKRKETSVAERERLLTDNVRLQYKLDAMAHKHEVEVARLQGRIDMLQESKTDRFSTQHLQYGLYREVRGGLRGGTGKRQPFNLCKPSLEGGVVGPAGTSSTFGSSISCQINKNQKKK